MNLAPALLQNALFFLVCILSGCGSSPPEAGGGGEFIHDLTKQIRKADKIIFREHSAPRKYWENENWLSTVEVYEEIALSKDQKRAFLETIENLNPETQHTFSFCDMPQYHHSIEFFDDEDDEDSVGILMICFGCRDISWKGTKATPPESVYAELDSFITKFGLHPKGEWAALAEKASRGKGKSLGVKPN